MGEAEFGGDFPWGLGTFVGKLLLLNGTGAFGGVAACFSELLAFGGE